MQNHKEENFGYLLSILKNYWVDELIVKSHHRMGEYYEFSEQLAIALSNMQKSDTQSKFKHIAYCRSEDDHRNPIH